MGSLLTFSGPSTGFCGGDGVFALRVLQSGANLVYNETEPGGSGFDRLARRRDQRARRRRDPWRHLPTPP
jgi:hypothetical protein